MPFPDEISLAGVQVLEYQPRWVDEFNVVAKDLSAILGPIALYIDHIGSTSIPGIAAKDCIDIQIRVASVADPEIERRMAGHGFRQRPEEWNRRETSFGEMTEKRVYAPPAGSRSINIHIRKAESISARFVLLFRYYLRSNPPVRDAWAAFKLRLSQSVGDLYNYGQIKQPATAVLMEGARNWAEQTCWAPTTVNSYESPNQAEVQPRAWFEDQLGF